MGLATPSETESRVGEEKRRGSGEVRVGGLQGGGSG